MLLVVTICWFMCVVFYMGSLLHSLGIRVYKSIGHLGTSLAYYRTLFFKVYPMTCLWFIKSILWVRNGIEKWNGKVAIRVHHRLGKYYLLMFVMCVCLDCSVFHTKDNNWTYFKNPTLKQHFSTVALLTFWARWFFVVGLSCRMVSPSQTFTH